MSIKNKLNRLKPHLGGETHSVKITQSVPQATETSAEIPFIDIWNQNGVKPYFADQDFCLVKEAVYPLDMRHGKYRFLDFRRAVEAWNESELNHPLSSSGFSPEDLFFFDTETTGLGGGTGNVIFLLGHACMTENEVVVKQHILPNPGSEVPLYKSFLESIDYSKMVTYNGKAFDWPQVKTRHTLIREHVPKLPPFGHFDLYHAARRIWKHKLERLKLSVVEKEILDFQRKDDIPGFLAPMIYFDFVERKDPEGMLGILKHNEMDILSLITLYTHLSFQLLRLDDRQTVQETFEVGRWYSYLGESAAAEKVFSDLSEGDDLEAIKAKHALAFGAKKKKDWIQAIQLWEPVVGKGNKKIQIEACIELAKIYEHRMKQYSKAIEYVEKAMVICPPIDERDQDDLEKRLSRLHRKWDVEKDKCV
jgi:uncharacterized protein